MGFVLAFLTSDVTGLPIVCQEKQILRIYFKIKINNLGTAALSPRLEMFCNPRSSNVTGR